MITWPSTTNMAPEDLHYGCLPKWSTVQVAEPAEHAIDALFAPVVVNQRCAFRGKRAVRKGRKGGG